MRPVQCGLPQETRYFERLADLPFEVRANFLAHVGEVADVDEPYNQTDVTGLGMPPQRGYLGGGQVGGRLFLWYARGGRLLTVSVIGYFENTAARPGERRFGRLANSHFRSNPCGATRAILDGVTTGNDRDL